MLKDLDIDALPRAFLLMTIRWLVKKLEFIERSKSPAVMPPGIGPSVKRMATRWADLVEESHVVDDKVAATECSPSPPSATRAASPSRLTPIGAAGMQVA